MGVQNPRAGHRLLVGVAVAPSGLLPVALLAAAFAAFGVAVGAPVPLAALIGATGGTASLLVHELGHVGAARRAAGIRSAAVSLFWFGAATRFEGRYASGREQTRIAVAGPLTSFVVAFALVAVCAVPMPFEIRELVLLLALFNVAIGVLNLLPAYPLDGYKIAVGLLWAVTGSERKARRLLRRIGVGWAAIEVPAAVVVLMERPRLGFVVAVVGGVVLAQKRLARKPAESERAA